MSYTTGLRHCAAHLCPVERRVQRHRELRGADGLGQLGHRGWLGEDSHPEGRWLCGRHRELHVRGARPHQARRRPVLHQPVYLIHPSQEVWGQKRQGMSENHPLLPNGSLKNIKWQCIRQHCLVLLKVSILLKILLAWEQWSFYR